MAWSGGWGTAWADSWADGVVVGPTPSGQRAWGDSWGESWSDAWGGLPANPTYTPASVTVRAFRVMFFGGVIRNIGDTFQITSPQQFTPYGMVLVTTPPADWSQFMEAYVETIDNSIVRFPGRDETRLPTRDGTVVTPEAGNPYD